MIDDFIWVLNPFLHNCNINLSKSIYLRESYVFMRTKFPFDYLREAKNIFHWAITDNGEFFLGN